MPLSLKAHRRVRLVETGGRVRNVRITTVDSQTQLDLRLGHGAATSFLNVAKATAATDTNAWAQPGRFVGA